MTEYSSLLIPIQLSLLLFLSFRYVNLDDIWNEIEPYQRKVEKEFAQYLESKLLNPAYDRIAELKDETEQRTRKKLVEEYDQSIEDDDDLDHLVKAIMFEEMIGQGELKKSFIADALVSQDVLNPQEIMRESKNFNNNYRNIQTVFTYIQMSMVLYMLSTGFVVLSLFFNWGEILSIWTKISGLMVISWFLLETLLWRMLSKKISMNDKTLVERFLKPDPREFV